jgi:hypothetical protein
MSDPVAASDSRGVGVLEYRGAEAPELVLRRRRVRICLLGIALAAAVSPFLAFDFGESPWSVVKEWMTSRREATLALIGLPFFAGVVAAGWKLRLIFDAPPSRVARCIVYWLAGMFATATGTVCVMMYLNDLNFAERLQVLVAPGVMALGVGVITWHAVKGRRTDAVTAAIFFAYAANAAMCLVIFSDSNESGWWLTLATVSAMGVEMVTTIVLTALGR